MPNSAIQISELPKDTETAGLVAQTGEMGDLAIQDALVDVKRSVGKGVVKILDLIAQYPDITRERLAREVGLSVRGVEKNLAQLKSKGKIVRVVAHNHPSGDPTPSRKDVDLTKELEAASKVLRIPLLDHLVIGSPQSADGVGFVSICKSSR